MIVLNIHTQEYEDVPEREAFLGAVQGKYSIVKNDTELSYLYARNVVHGRWPDGESAILKKPYSCFLYAKNIIKGRWPEAEPVIMQDPSATNSYAQLVIGDRWPEAEPIILNSSPIWIFWYVENVIDGRWPEAEPKLIDYPHLSCWYAFDIMCERWYEAEEQIKKDQEWWDRYKNHFNMQ